MSDPSFDRLTSALAWEPVNLESFPVVRERDFTDRQSLTAIWDRVRQLLDAVQGLVSMSEEMRSALDAPPLRTYVYEYNIWRNRLNMVLADESLAQLDASAPLLAHDATERELMVALAAVAVAYGFASAQAFTEEVAAVPGRSGRVFKIPVVPPSPPSAATAKGRTGP